MLNRLFINIVIIISFLYINGILDFRFHIKEKKYKFIFSGILFGILGIVLMLYTVDLGNNTITDLRHLAIIIVATYSGAFSTIICAIIIALARILLFGFTSAALVASIFVMLLGIICALISPFITNHFKKINILNLLSLIIIFISLCINLRSLNKTLSIYPYVFFVSILSVWFMYSIANYIDKSNTSFYDLQYKTSQLNTLLSSLNSGILAEDIKGNITYTNSKFFDLFNIDYTDNNILNSNSLDLAYKVDKYLIQDSDFIKNIKLNIENKTIKLNEEIHLKNGKIIERDFIPIFSNNNYIGHFWNFRDITEKKLTEKKLRDLSQIDGLTGISNRRVFNDFILEQWNYCKEHSQFLSLIMFDIDHFKLFNDTYGHLSGDECLKAVAKVLAIKAFRPEDLAARYGGEEFVLVLPNADLSYAKKIGEELRKDIDGLNITHVASKTTDHVTISLGVVSMIPNDSTSLKDFIDFADKALYKAKSNGRNRIEIYNV